jgi:hypothetical protein
MHQSIRYNLTLSKILQLIVLLYQSIAVIIFIAALVFAYKWLQEPFLGAFFEPTMLSSPAGPGKPSDAWQLYNQGVRHGDQLRSVAGKEIRNAKDLEQVLSNFFPGETVPVVVRSVDGKDTTYNVELHMPQSMDLWFAP